MTRVYLHIGAPKTGTTYLQEVLFNNRARLAQRGVLFPGDSSSAHYAAALDLRELDFGGYDDPDAEGAWDAVVAETRSWRGDAVVISHELLAGAHEPAVERALASLAGHEVHVVLTARDLGRQVPAVWQEMIKNNQTISYAAYLKQLTSKARKGRAARIFWRQQDAAGVLAHWSQYVPAERVHLVTVPPAGSSPTLLWERLCTVLGIASDGYDTVVPRANVSLGLAEAELLRRTNEELGGRLDWPQFASVAKFWLAEELLSARVDSARAQVPDRLRPWFAKTSQAMIDEIVAHDYDVVGDLADLEPVYGSTGAASTPMPSDVVDAAAYALAAVLLDRVEGRQGGMMRDMSDRLRGPHRRRVLRILPEGIKQRLRRTNPR